MNDGDRHPNGLPQRRLGRTRLQVSELGIGTAPLGNLYRPISDAAAHEAVTAALDSSINYVDCAPYYGFGLCETRLGNSLQGRPGVILSTKVGRLLEPAPQVADDAERCGFRSAMPFTPVFDYSYEGVMRSWEASLRRLQRSRIDILYIHDIGQLTHGDEHEDRLQQLIAGGGLRALAQLRSAGQIDAFGLGVNEIPICLRLLHETDLDIILLAGRYTLLEQDALDELLPECVRRGTSVVVGGPYNSGILATGASGVSEPRYNYQIAPTDIVFQARRLERVCNEFGIPLAAAALQFPLAHPAVAAVIPGLGSGKEVAQALSFYRTSIPAAFWDELKSQRMIREDAPVRTDMVSQA